MCDRLPLHIPGNCPPPTDDEVDRAMLGFLLAPTPERAIEDMRNVERMFCLEPASAIALDVALAIGDPSAERLLAMIDPFCPRHGRASRPAEIPGLRCDCPQPPRSWWCPICKVLYCDAEVTRDREVSCPHRHGVAERP